MVKYKLGSNGFNEGVVLIPGKKGIIQQILYDKGGDWAFLKKNEGNGEILTFPLFGYYSNGKRSLSQLTNKEFEELTDKIPFLPREEIFECYELLKDAA